jgi:hypothetical protein
MAMTDQPNFNQVPFVPGPWRAEGDIGWFDILSSIKGGAPPDPPPKGKKRWDDEDRPRRLHELQVEVGGSADALKIEATTRLIQMAPDMYQILCEAFDCGVCRTQIRRVFRHVYGVKSE